MTDRIDHTARWGIEHRRRGDKTWTLLGTAGSRDQAERWLIRFSTSGDFRIRQPQPRR